MNLILYIFCFALLFECFSEERHTNPHHNLCMKGHSLWLNFSNSLKLYRSLWCTLLFNSVHIWSLIFKFGFYNIPIQLPIVYCMQFLYCAGTFKNCHVFVNLQTLRVPLCFPRCCFLLILTFIIAHFFWYQHNSYWCFLRYPPYDFWPWKNAEVEFSTFFQRK